MQADPIIQAPFNAQSLNRYSYGWNNPLNGTDPSGYSFLRRLVGVLTNGIIGEALASINPHFRTLFQIGACLTGNIGACAASAFGNTIAAGGSFGDALRAGAIAAFSQWAGGQIAGGGTIFGGELAGQALGFGIVGGTASVLGGGKFGHGFVAAGFSTLAGGNVRLPSGSSSGAIIGRVLIKATIGGTASRITGGKFANGAVTAAFSAIAMEGAAGNLDDENSRSNEDKGYDSRGVEVTYVDDKIYTGGVDSNGNLVLAQNDFQQCWNTCISENYGDLYALAADNSLIAPVTLALNGASSVLEEFLDDAQIRNRNRGGDLKKFNTGQRQLKTLSQFKKINAAGAVLGAGALGFQAGAAGYCAVQASLSCSP